MSLRSYDLKNDPIILVYKNPPDTGICKFPFRVIVNKEKKIALSASRTVDSNCICSIDSVQLVNLAVTFCKYNIAHLSVDSAGEVTIKTEFSKTKPSLLKLMEEEKRPDSSKKWERLTGNWFQLKD